MIWLFAPVTSFVHAITCGTNPVFMPDPVEWQNKSPTRWFILNWMPHVKILGIRRNIIYGNGDRMTINLILRPLMMFIICMYFIHVAIGCSSSQVFWYVKGAEGVQKEKLALIKCTEGVQTEIKDRDGKPLMRSKHTGTVTYDRDDFPAGCTSLFDIYILPGTYQISVEFRGGGKKEKKPVNFILTALPGHTYLVNSGITWPWWGKAPNYWFPSVTDITEKKQQHQ